MPRHRATLVQDSDIVTDVTYKNGCTATPAPPGSPALAGHKLLVERTYAAMARHQGG